MKKKMAVIISLVLACSMSMTAMAKSSPSIVDEPVEQTVVSDSVEAASNAVAATTTGVTGDQSSVLEGTTFTTESGAVVDPAAVSLVVSPTTAEQTNTAAASLAAAMTSKDVKVLNMTNRDELSLTDAQGRLNVVNNVNVGLQTATGEAVSQNGSVSVAFKLADILGSRKLAANETVQALYQRADGTWVAVPVVIIDGAVAIALPAFSGAVDVTFVVAKGASLTEIPVKTSPRT